MDGATKKSLAVVSGGTGYLGSAIVTALKDAGWNAIALSHSDCDVTSHVEVEKAISKIVADGPKIGAIIHAAASPVAKTALLEADDADFDQQIVVAVRGAFNLAKATAPHMEHGGAFIGITSKLIEPGATALQMGS